jgi:hypothetical protein
VRADNRASKLGRDAQSCDRATRKTDGLAIEIMIAATDDQKADERPKEVMSVSWLATQHQVLMMS